MIEIIIVLIIYLLSVAGFKDTLDRYSLKFSFFPYKAQYDMGYVPILNTILIVYMWVLLITD